MIIQVYGSPSCNGCKKFYEGVKALADTEGLNAEVYYITDLTEAARKGIIVMPAVEADGVIITQGKHIKKSELIRLIKGI